MAWCMTVHGIRNLQDVTTRAEIRRLLTDFRDMVRARGPGELLEVANLQWYRPGEFENSAAEWLHHHGAARAALRWWRWANRQERWVEVYDGWDWTIWTNWTYGH